MQVVLDLDETLVCAYETSSLPSIVRSQAIEAGLKCFELECISTDRVTCFYIVTPFFLVILDFNYKMNSSVLKFLV